MRRLFFLVLWEPLSRREAHEAVGHDGKVCAGLSTKVGSADACRARTLLDANSKVCPLTVESMI